MGYKARKRLALLVLVVGLPLYIAVAVGVMSWMLNADMRLPKAIEFIVYVVLGIGWAFPLKWVFQGIGQENPDQDR